MKPGWATINVQLTPRPAYCKALAPVMPTAVTPFYPPPHPKPPAEETTSKIHRVINVKPATKPLYTTNQLIPHLQLKNDKVDQFAEVLAGSYMELFRRWGKGGLRDPDRVFFETVITRDSYQTFVTTNTGNEDLVKQQAGITWKHVTLKETACPLQRIDRKITAAYDIRIKRPFFLSLKTDRRLTESPLGEIFEVSRSMQDGDTAILQVGFQAAEESWYKDAEDDKRDFDQKRPRWWPPGREISEATRCKPGQNGYDVTIRLLVTSPDDRRRRRVARGLIFALKQLNHDNELQEKQIWDGRLSSWIQKARRREIRVPWLFGERQILTAAEIAHFIKLPQRNLQEEYPSIENVSKPEINLPDELFLNDVQGIDVGLVTEKGKSRTARIPVSAYPGVEEKYVRDTYCLPEFVFGEMGSGKTGEAIHRANSAIRLGQTVFFFDSADGAAVKELHDSLPPDYPEEKIIHLDLTNKAWPIPLSWSFSPATLHGDDELQAEQAREAGKAFLRQFVSGMATADFTNRMDRYLAAAARAAGSAPLDIELALTSPSYREELLSRPEVAAALDVVSELEYLQDKARRGSDDISVDGILSRLRVLSSDRFRTNLFYQTSRQPLDFRRYADNPEGGYGYCVTVYCDKSSFGPDGQEAILTYLFAKVLLEGAYSRVDIAPSDRKPFVVLLDEPHRFIRGEMATKLGEEAAVELRKYRCKLVMFGHSRAQLGKLWDSFESGGVQVTLYKSKQVQTFRDLAPVIAPLDPDQAWSSLGQHEAVVTRKLPSKRDVAFICKMAAPPPFVRDRSKRREACLRQFGRHWKDVSEEIKQRRLEYDQKDREWHNRMEEVVREAKEREKEERRRVREEEKRVKSST